MYRVKRVRCDNYDPSFLRTSLNRVMQSYVSSIKKKFVLNKMALKSFRPGLYDLLILDIRMPKMNGIDLYNKISKTDENIRVCFLSANEQFYEDI